jgi:hypothetical protein
MKVIISDKVCIGTIDKQQILVYCLFLVSKSIQQNIITSYSSLNLPYIKVVGPTCYYYYLIDCP